MTDINDLEIDQDVQTPDGIRRITELRFWNNTVVVSDTDRGEKGGLLTIFDESDIETIN